MKALLNKIVMTAPFLKQSGGGGSTPAPASITPSSKTDSPKRKGATTSKENTSTVDDTKTSASKRKMITFNEEEVTANKKIKPTLKITSTSSLPAKSNTNKEAVAEEISKSSTKRKVITYNDEDKNGLKKLKHNFLGSTNIIFDNQSRYREQRLREADVVARFSSTSGLKSVLTAYTRMLSSISASKWPSLELKKLSIQKLADEAGVENNLDLLDLLLVMYECGTGYYQNPDNSPISANAAVKIGEVSMTPTNRKLIQAHGIRSIRCKSDTDMTWQLPDTWRILLPQGKNLGEGWGKEEDSRLLMAAYKHNMDLNMIVADNTLGFKSVGFEDTSGNIHHDFEERYGYLLNLYIFKGMFNEEVRFLASKLQPPPAVPETEQPGSLLDQSTDSQTIDLSFEEEVTSDGGKGNNSLDNLLEEISQELPGKHDSIDESIESKSKDLIIDTESKDAIIEVTEKLDEAVIVKSGENDATGEVETSKNDAN